MKSIIAKQNNKKYLFLPGVWRTLKFYSNDLLDNNEVTSYITEDNFKSLNRSTTKEKNLNCTLSLVP